MEPSTSQQRTKDKDVNSRLRYGLNTKCLAHIFRYLDSVDLYIVSGMNDFYKQIINELVIPNHSVKFFQLFEKGISGAQVFERFGTRIQKIRIDDVYVNKTSVLQLITQHFFIL